MNPILVLNRRCQIARLMERYPGYRVLDLTKNSPDEGMARFSPFYPHGGIPVPFSNLVSESVEGIWQGLKVFRRRDGSVEDTDESCFANRTMKHLKRSLRAKGRLCCLGHRRVSEGDVLGYVEARKLIYLPSYRYVLNHHLQKEVQTVMAVWQNAPLILLDYTTNTDIDNPRKPLSHAGLVMLYLQELARSGEEDAAN